jgi:hypothetical protein
MKKIRSQSEGLEASVKAILDLRAARVRALAPKVARLKKRLAVLRAQNLKKASNEII